MEEEKERVPRCRKIKVTETIKRGRGKGAEEASFTNVEQEKRDRNKFQKLKQSELCRVFDCRRSH